MEKTLVILAAGMGSRFGGLKQMAPMGPNGEFIIDYSIYDAIKCGFTKVVFVIKKALYEDFRNTIGLRVENKIKCEYVFQELDDVPFSLDFQREKPWGTGHAILVCKNVVHENFVIINADDFYGREAFEVASKNLELLNQNEYGIIGYKAINTLTENGSVKRGVCETSNGLLVNIKESSLEKNGDIISCETLTTHEKFDIDYSELVSMNMILFNPGIFDYLENDFKDFLNNLKDNFNDEFLIPEVIENHIKNGDVSVKVIETDAKWFGVTYKEDSEKVQNNILKMIDEGKYNNNLWG